MNGIVSLVDRLLARSPESFNTDWDGTLAATALAEWGKTSGDARCAAFANRWFEHHKSYTGRLTDEEYRASYIGVHARVIRSGPIPFTAYCGHWGLVYPMAILAETVKDGTPQAVAKAVADYILHTVSRSVHGCVYHDEGARFLIPDTCYFAAPCLAIASHLTGREVYLEQALSQLKAYIELMQDPATGFAHTYWSPEGMPRNFWSRASGWLAGAYTNTLPYVRKDHPDYEPLADSFRKLMAGVQNAQRADGGFHVLLDRPDAPIDCTGPAMLGIAMKKGVSLGLLDSGVLPAADAAWEAAALHIGPDGEIRGAYTGWAQTAVKGELGPEQFDRTRGEPVQRDFVYGLLLLAAAAFPEKSAHSAPCDNIPSSKTPFRGKG